jgi:hypothetical protein
MLLLRHPVRMSPANFPTMTLIPTHEDGANATTPGATAAPVVEIDRLVVRVAAPSDRDALAELALRAGVERPQGALMVGELDGRVVAAVPLDGGHAASEPTPVGAAAGAVVRYRVAQLSRRSRGIALAA